jgi:hypothetical protein
MGSYASLSRLTANHRRFPISRRFDEISVRTLLYLQDGVGDLERRLHKLGKEDGDDGIPFNLWRLHSRGDNYEERLKITKEIREKLKEYSRYIGFQNYH